MTGFRCPRNHKPWYVPYISPGVEFNYCVDGGREKPMEHGDTDLLICDKEIWENQKVVGMYAVYTLEPDLMPVYFSWMCQAVLLSAEKTHGNPTVYRVSFEVIDPDTITMHEHAWLPGKVQSVGHPDIWPVRAEWNGETWTALRHPWMIKNNIDWPNSCLGGIEAKRTALNRWMDMEQLRKKEGLPVFTDWIRLSGLAGCSGNKRY